ncbi:hypothetical protein [Amantichitinum ursilacus]|uniref:Uncharacterized protein n=1 Tax=Amantichitinum ursilacus TaxID=857265 RepID=A0A0N1JRT3_9NEIS|nr:hypothetical protein [Amantichitinum ursilacus]KPC49888.1 hypothetical protein WG78_19120 [Amantichitinum ursilacus]
MAWPIPQLQLQLQSTTRPYAFILIALALLLPILIGAVTGVLHCPNYTYVAAQFWLPATYATAQSLLLFGGAIVMVIEYGEYKHVIWNHWRVLELYTWQRWTHNPLALLASHVLLPEADIAARMAGLEPGPPDAASVGKVLFADEILAAGQFRFQRICQELLTAVGPALAAAQARSHARLQVWLQSPITLTDLHCEQVREQISQAGLPAPQKISVLDNNKVLEAQQTFRSDDQVIHLVLALQYHATVDDDTPEGAAALVLCTGWHAAHYGQSTCNQLFRPMQTRTSTLAADMHTWITRGQQPRDQLKQLWIGSLDKSTQYSIKTLAGDMALPLRQNPPAFGVFDLEKSLGRFGPVAYWLMLALGTELVACNQGSQALALGNADRIDLQMTGLANSEWARFGTPDQPFYYPAAGIIMVGWGIAMALAAIPIILDPQADNAPTTIAAAILGLLALGTPLIYAKWLENQWRPHFEYEVRSTTP